MKQISPDTMRIGWIGTGVMGHSMCRHLLEAGYAMRVHNRTKSKADTLVELGAKWCDSPAELARECDVVFLIVGHPSDVRQVLLGDDQTENGVFSALSPGGIVVDMTTSSPQLAESMAAEAASRQLHLIDAPVSGSDIGAKNATLSIMVGGEKPVFDVLRPVFEKMGQNIVYHGSAGRGQHAKMVNQILVATNMIGLCEGLLYAYRSGLDLENVLKSITPGAAGSWTLTNLGPRILNGDFEPGFYIEHIVKDLGIAVGECRRMGLVLPGLALADSLFRLASAHGFARNGTQALILALAEIAKIDWKR